MKYVRNYTLNGEYKLVIEDTQGNNIANEEWSWGWRMAECGMG